MLFHSQGSTEICWRGYHDLGNIIVVSIHSTFITSIHATFVLPIYFIFLNDLFLFSNNPLFSRLAILPVLNRQRDTSLLFYFSLPLSGIPIPIYLSLMPPSFLIWNLWSFRKKTRAELVRVSAAVMGIEFSYAAETAFVSPTLLKIGVDHQHMTLVWALSPLVGFFVTPILGSISDRCRLKHGRRRPFILLLALGVFIGKYAIFEIDHIFFYYEQRQICYYS